jgi:hypothetical protein
MAQYAGVNSIINEDLPGCTVELSEGNYEVLMSRYKKMLSIEKKQGLINVIQREAREMMVVSPDVYCINEAAYEYRKVFNREKRDEKKILIRWSKMIMRKFGDDAGLDFFLLVMKNRSNR